MRVLIDGEAVDPKAATLSVFDQTILRGAGCFEALRAYDGVAFEIERHLDRLESSARSLEVPLPAREQLSAWIDDVAGHSGDGLVRVLATPGAPDPKLDAPPRVIVFTEPLPPAPDVFRLLPLVAPWHSAGASWTLEGVKSLSYGPNVAAQREAKKRGFDDALLLSREGFVLEAPMAAVAWVKDGALCLPTTALGVLRSVTRAVVVEEAKDLGIETREVKATLDELNGAFEVMLLSTSRAVRPVVAVGDLTFAPGDVTRRLSQSYDARAQRARADRGLAPR